MKRLVLVLFLVVAYATTTAYSVAASTTSKTAPLKVKSGTSKRK